MNAMTNKILDNFQSDKLLLITAERLGDTLFLVPAIKLLHQMAPNLKLDILALSPLAGAIFNDNPYVNKIHVARGEREIRQLAADYPLALNLMFEMQKHLTRFPTELISIGQPDLKRHRATQVTEFIQGLITCHGITEEYPYELFPQSNHSASVRDKLQQAGIDLDQHRVVGLQLGCHRVARRGWKFWSKKRHRHSKVWPIEYYVELVRRLSAKSDKLRFVLTGSESERFLGKMFTKDCPDVVDLIGATNLFELTALMDYVKLYITHDTGSLHIACARQTPLIALFGPIPVSFTGPYPKQEKFSVIAKPTMAEISVEEVERLAVAKLGISKINT